MLSFTDQVGEYQGKMVKSEKEYRELVSVFKKQVYFLTRMQEQLKSEQNIRHKDLNFCQSSLTRTLKKFTTLMDLKEQAEMDWKLKLEEINTICYNRQEELFSALADAKNDVCQISETF